MSVRRLAEESVQPGSFAFTEENEAWAREWIKKYPEGRQHSAVIPLMMRAQDQEGWLTRPAIEAIAEMLDMPIIRALEVATFYTMFQLKPVGTEAHIQVCGTTPCMLRGAEDLRAVCQRKINEEPLVPSEDGKLSWEEVECLGACVNAPMVLIGHDTYEDLTPERFEEIVEAFRAGKGDSVPAGPQIDRVFSAPVTGQTTLNEVPAGGGAKARPAPKASEKPAEKSGGAPFKAPKGKPDDLKMIAGLGPKLEKDLIALGVTTFAQIAAFTEDDIEKIDAHLKIRGRIERDDWRAQADALATGGVEEYVKRFGKEPR